MAKEIDIRLTKPQRGVAEWLVHRLGEELPPNQVPVLEKTHIIFPPSKDVIRMAYHLLNYEYRILWKENPDSVPSKPVTAESLSYSLIVYSGIQARIYFENDELEDLRGRSFSKVKGRPSAGAIAKVRQTLEESVDRIGPALLKQLKNEYLERSDEALEYFFELAKDIERRNGSPSYNDTAYYGIREYIKYNEEAARKQGVAGYWGWGWERVRTNPELFSANHEHAVRQAELAFRNARSGFIEKNVSKLSSIMGKREDLQDFQVEFHYECGVFVGNLVLELSDALIEAELSLKYVIRTIPHITPYFQYPLNFTRAVVQGQEMHRPSEEELVVALGGELYNS
jgi:hypothetical protein